MTLNHTDVEALDAQLAEFVASGRLPHLAAAVIDSSGELHTFNHGHLATGAAAPFTVDSVIWLASTTKLVVALAALQLVEQGALALDAPLKNLLPELGQQQVLDPDGSLREPDQDITLRHLLSHTAGNGYAFFNPSVRDFQDANGIPPIIECRTATLQTPLTFDPGSRWEYGTNIEWVGRAIERAGGQTLEQHLKENILQPLGMESTAFILDEHMRGSRAAIHYRGEDGSLSPTSIQITQDPEFFMGGGGLYGTVRDYMKLLRMLLGEGTLDGTTIISASMLAEARRNQIGQLRTQPVRTADPATTRDVDFLPEFGDKWSLLGLRNDSTEPNGRSRGSLFWCGLANTYYWVDWEKGTAGYVAAQVLPFADPEALAAFSAVESVVNGEGGADAGSADARMKIDLEAAARSPGRPSEDLELELE
ncbi:serine hydrolase domain-containing protein [Brevibacterium daeguense]|uniref:Serine hydrolase domain-containing protein n=1 Tax=Brevibacterium daeguense TaxID=909936 RepID=A0ABP8EIY5_9MICO|nr:serine hydrolase domain-containing protein [Brevibacterium daeguense]